MVDYTKVDTDVTNIIDDAGVEESQLIQTDEPLTIIFGELNSGIPVTAEVDHFAVMNVYRDLDEEEQAMYGGSETLDFSSVLLAGADGEAEQEHVVNVSGGSMEHALEAFERVVDDGIIDLEITDAQSFEVQDGELIETTVEEGEDE